MSYIYGCSKCNYNIERPSKQIITCEICGDTLKLLASRKVQFKCQNCKKPLNGQYGGRSVYECPFCGGQMTLSRTI